MCYKINKNFVNYSLYVIKSSQSYVVTKLRWGVSGEMFKARLERGKDEADGDRHIYQSTILLNGKKKKTVPLLLATFVKYKSMT